MSAAFSQFCSGHPSIKYYFPSAAEYPKLKATYVYEIAEPCVIARPQTLEDVAALVFYCATNGVDPVVRAGGHDLSARSTVHGALQIDMRDIAYVHVDRDRQTARVGGGILQGKLLEELEKQHLYTATGSVATVGYVSWASQGGYGPSSPSLGFGLDQILGAKIVTAEGNVVDANEDLLQGIRGAGGNFGVIVELTVKVYPLQEFQAGTITFEATPLPDVINTYFANFDQLVSSHVLPDNLYLQHSVFDVPDIGTRFIVNFTWIGPKQDSVAWQRRIAGLGPHPILAIETTTPAGYVKKTTSMIPRLVYPGKVQTINIKGLGLRRRTAEVFAKYAGLHPGGGALISAHCLHGKATRGPFPPNVFRSREPHSMFEIVGLTNVPDDSDAARNWADAFASEMKRAGDALEGTYISLTPKEDVDPRRIYGDNYELLKALKKQLDPSNLFKHAVARL